MQFDQIILVVALLGVAGILVLGRDHNGARWCL